MRGVRESGDEGDLETRVVREPGDGGSGGDWGSEGDWRVREPGDVGSEGDW